MTGFEGIEAFHRITPDLTGPERLAVFLSLPEPIREESWRRLDARIEARGRAAFAAYRAGPTARPGEIAAQIASLWPELEAAEMLPAPDMPVREPRRPGEPKRERGEDLDRRLEALRSIPSAVYVPDLTAREVTRGFVVCPFHEERTASLHVSESDGRWHCFGCGAGGDLLDFLATMEGRSVPDGREFLVFVLAVADELLGRED